MPESLDLRVGASWAPDSQFGLWKSWAGMPERLCSIVCGIDSGSIPRDGSDRHRVHFVLPQCEQCRQLESS